MKNNVTIEYCIEKLKALQKCNLNPKECKHDYNEHGENQKFDYATIDMVLDQIICELEHIDSSQPPKAEAKRPCYCDTMFHPNGC